MRQFEKKLPPGPFARSVSWTDVRFRPYPPNWSAATESAIACAWTTGLPNVFSMLSA
jgi:hypothetical protein